MAQDSSSILDSIPFGQISSGFFIGLAVGYFFKKSLKILLLLFGLLIVILFALQAYEVIQISSDTLLSGTDKLIILIKAVGSFLKEQLSFLELSGGAGAVAGFLVGLKMG